MVLPQILILLFGIQEFAALHQGAMHYRQEHKGSLRHFLEIVIPDAAASEVGKSLVVYGPGFGVEEGSVGHEGSVSATIIATAPAPVGKIS